MGLSPLIETSSWLSTMPRITIPTRSDRKNQYRKPEAVRSEGEDDDLLPGDEDAKDLYCFLKAESAGSSEGCSGTKRVATDSMMRINPTVATTLTVSLAPSRDLAIRSSASPATGA